MPAFRSPTRPVRVRHGIAQLRFDCAEPAGCRSTPFVLRRRARAGIGGFSCTIRVAAGARGSQLVRVRFATGARRVLRRLGRAPFLVTIVRSGVGEAPTAFKLRSTR